VAITFAVPAAAVAKPPETTIVAGPAGPTTDPAPSFSFDSDQPGSSFECRLDGGTWTLRAPGPVLSHLFDPRWAPCASPTSYAHIDDGAHLFEVRAVSADGEPDPSPASRTFVVDTRVAGELSAREIQRQAPGTAGVRARISAEEQLAVSAGGEISLRRRDRARLRFRLQRRAVAVAAGRVRRLRLRPTRRSEARRIAAALRRGRRADATVRARLSNSLGSSVVRRLEVELR
jgi:hypothetical protein